MWQTDSLASGSCSESSLILKKSTRTVFYFCQVSSDISSETPPFCLKLVLGSELSLETPSCYFLLVCLSVALITLLIHSLFPVNPPQFPIELLFPFKTSRVRIFECVTVRMYQAILTKVLMKQASCPWGSIYLDKLTGILVPKFFLTRILEESRAWSSWEDSFFQRCLCFFVPVVCNPLTW